jgi:hypothetical protein
MSAGILLCPGIRCHRDTMSGDMNGRGYLVQG